MTTNPDEQTALINLLLAMPEQQEAAALLRRRRQTQALPGDFFLALKQQTLRTGADRHQQQKLQGLIDAALDLAADDQEAAMGLWARSVSLHFCQDWEAAVRATDAAMALYKRLGQHKAYCRLGANKINFLTFLMHLPKADECAMSTIAYARAHQVEEPDLYRNYATVKRYLHQPEAAFRLMEESRELIMARADAYGQAAFLVDAAPVYMQLDRYQEAEAYLRQAQIYFQPRGGWEWGVNAYCLAQLYLQMGRLHEALPLADESVRTHGAHGGSQEWPYVSAVLLQAQILLELGEYRRVLRQLALIEAGIRGDDQNALGQALFGLLQGYALMGIGRLEAAEGWLQWCVTLLQEPYARWANLAQLALGQLYREWARQDGQPAYLKKSRERLTELYERGYEMMPAQSVTAALLLAQIDLEEQQPDAAQAWLRRVAILIERFPRLQGTYQRLCGTLAQQQGDWTAARAHYEDALRLAEQVRQQFDLETWQVNFMSRQETLFVDLIETCWRQSDAAAVWRYSELSRAYSLTAALRDESLLDAADAEARQALYEQRARRFRLTAQLYHWLEQKVTPLSPEEEARVRQEIHDLDTRMGERMPALSQGTREGDGARMPAEISPHLPPDTLMLIYKRLSDSMLVMGLDRQGTVFAVDREIAWTRIEANLTQLVHIGVQELAFLLNGADGKTLPSLFAPHLQETQAVLRALYDALWQPYAARLQPYAHIVVVADDLLHYLPFQALFSGQDYVIDRHAISYAPGAAVYALCRQRALARADHWGHDVVLLAYEGEQGDLRHVTAEVDAIQSLFPQARMLVGAAATEDALRRQAASARILHLATHGFMNSYNPFLSSLELAAPHGSQRFSVYEAAQLDLRQTDLVCLSGCVTGQAVARGGEVLGLQWGFMNAGSYALLANLLPVDDFFAARLMPAFYRRYRPETGKAAALRQAQIALRDQSQAHPDAWERRFAHPYFWTPFCLYGYGGPIP